MWHDLLLFFCPHALDVLFRFYVSCFQRSGDCGGELTTLRRESIPYPITLEFAEGCAKRTKVPVAETRHLPACPCPASALLSLRRPSCRALSPISFCCCFRGLP